MAGKYVIAESFSDFIGTDWPDTTHSFNAVFGIDETPSTEEGKTCFTLHSQCRDYWHELTRFRQTFTVKIDGVTVGTTGELNYAYWVSDVPPNTIGTVSPSVTICVPAKGGRHKVSFTSSTSGEVYEYTVDLHPKLRITIKKPTGIKSISVKVEKCSFEAAKTLTAGGYAYGSTAYSWEAVPEAGYELKTPSGSGTLTAALTISPEVMPMATAELYSGGKWVRYFLMLYAGGKWSMYRAQVYSGGRWNSYF